MTSLEVDADGVEAALAGCRARDRLSPVKAEIHPKYELSVVKCSCGNEFETRSTKGDMTVEICAECHPFYTGKQKLIDTGGRVERFQKRLAKSREVVGATAPVTPVGGQAVLEGVMMRTPRFWAVSVRRPDGRISHVSHAATSVAARHRLLRLPFIRGIVALGDSLAIGFRALGLSAQWAASDDDSDEVTEELSTAGRSWSRSCSRSGSRWCCSRPRRRCSTDLFGLDGVVFALVEGAIRVGILVGYLALLSLIPDLKRVFQYHAAEHMAINALEAGDELTPTVGRRATRGSTSAAAPRSCCG